MGMGSTGVWDPDDPIGFEQRELLLIVRYEDGSEETLSSGEVTIRPSQKTL